MKIEESITTILTLVTRYKTVYKQFEYLQLHLKELDHVNIAEFGTPVPLRKSLIATTTDVMFILSESILEEYEHMLNPKRYPKHEDEILDLARDIQPALKRFKKWTDRRPFRNTLVAHNLRLKRKVSIFNNSDGKIEFNAPHFDNDYIIIYHLHLYMCRCLGKHFREIIQVIEYPRIIDMVDFTGKWASWKAEVKEIHDWYEGVGLDRPMDPPL